MRLENFRVAEEFAHGLKTSAKQRVQKISHDLEIKGRERILLETPIDYPRDFDEYIKEKITLSQNEKPSYPIVLGTHKSHPAGVPALVIAARIRKIFSETERAVRLTGSTLIVAGNIEGGQNETVTKFFRAAKPIMDKLDAVSTGVIRKKDTVNMDEDTLRKTRIRQGIALVAGIKKRRVPVVLPEASVESGRLKKEGKKGEINGMIPLEEGSVTYITTIMSRQGYEPLIFFIGNTGENKIYDPETEKITKTSKRRGGLRLVPGLRHAVPSIMSSVVDYPVYLQEIIDSLGTNGELEEGVLEQYCGERLAQLIPQHERGVYSNPSLLNKSQEIKRRDEHLPRRGIIFRRQNH